MDVSQTSGTPKSSILIGFSIINHPFWDTPIFGNTHTYICVYLCIFEFLIWSCILLHFSFKKDFSTKRCKMNSKQDDLLCTNSILLMDKILHHLGWLKPYKQWDNHDPWWCGILSIKRMLLTTNWVVFNGFPLPLASFYHEFYTMLASRDWLHSWLRFLGFRR